MNIHDQRRRDQLAKTLQKAKEQAETCKLYLSANDCSDDELNSANLALEHIGIALEHLGLAVETREEVKGMELGKVLEILTGQKSGSVYATGMLKACEVKQMAAEFKAQETIGPMTERVLQENGCRVI